MRHAHRKDEAIRQHVLLTAPEVEELTRGAIKTRRAFDLAAHGAFPPGVVVRLGRSVRFSRSRLEAWLGLDSGSQNGSQD